MDPVTIVCFLWGDWCAPHGTEYVEKLYRGIERNMPSDRSWKFICFNDGEVDVRCPYQNAEIRGIFSPTWMGKLPKVTVFDPAHGFSGQVFVFDLDTVITGSLQDVMSYTGDFCVRAWYGGIKRGKWIPDGDTLSFRAGAMTRQIWEPFVADGEEVERITGGRERYWYRHCVKEPDMWQRLFPDQFLSYKNHCRQGLPEDARVVSFHGQPRPHDVDADWVRENWK